MAPRKTKRNESVESVKVEEVEKVMDGEISSSTPTTGVTQTLTRRVTRSSSAASSASSSLASVSVEQTKKKKPRKSPKTEEKEEDDVKAEDDDEEKKEEEGSENKVSFIKTVIIEHCKQCRCFKQRADKVKNALENDVSGIKVLINPEKPRRGCFEVREEGGEAFITLLDLKRPFKKLKDLDMDDVIADIVDKIK